MMRVSVMYPYRKGARFDFDYYVGKHIPAALELMGSAVRAVTIERGLDPGPPWPPPTYACVCHFLCETLEGYQKAIAPHAATLQNDLANYSDIAPLIQVGEVIDSNLGHAESVPN